MQFAGPAVTRRTSSPWAALLGLRLAACAPAPGTPHDPSLCGDAPLPEAGLCPAACTGGCDSGTCNIDCHGFGACDAQTIDCPPDFDCALRCEGGDACDASRLRCAEGTACRVDCVDGTDACGDLILECGAAARCEMACSGTPLVCTGASVECGVGACAASCEGLSKPAVVCGDACECLACAAGDETTE